MNEQQDASSAGDRELRAIAHDLNNVLTAIGNSLQLMQLRLRRGETESLERFIAIGEDNVRKGAALTARLHDRAMHVSGRASPGSAT